MAFRAKLSQFISTWHTPVIIFSVSRLLVYWIPVLINHYGMGAPTWQAWDAQHYIDIATHGYTTGTLTGDGVLIVFLPFYPLVIRVFSLITTINPVTSALLMSFIFGLLSTCLLYRASKEWKDEATAIAVTLLLAFFPWSVFLSAPYTESLFLFLALISLRFLGRKQWLLAAVAISLATVTRLTGLVLLPLLAYELYGQKAKIPVALLSLLIACSAFAGYLAFQKINYGTPWAFLIAQRDHWYHTAGWPWQGLLSLWRGSQDTSDIAFMWRVDFWLSLTMIGTLVASFRAVPRLIWWFGVGVVIITLSSNFILGASRYLMMTLPFFFYWGWQLSKRPLALNLVIAGSTGWLAFNTLLFVLYKHIY